MSIYKPARSHNPLIGPAVCLCVECSRKVLALRCPARDAEGRQCGDYKHRGKEHSMLVLTVFAIAEERVLASTHSGGPDREQVPDQGLDGGDLGGLSDSTPQEPARDVHHGGERPA